MSRTYPSKPRPSRTPLPPPVVRPPSALPVFLVLLPLRLLSALTTPLSDCDEVFNYWEPLHFLLHETGLQTWEYSPQFSLRSYAFLIPYIVPARFPFPLPYSPKIRSFFQIRLFLALATSIAETFLHTATVRTFGSVTYTPLLVLLALSPGQFRAAVELLPSTFALQCLAVAAAFWFQLRFRPAIFFVALASLLGWIFAAALAVPMALHILLSNNGPRIFILTSLASAILILAYMTPIDSYYFGKLTLAPLNHLLYNVFPRPGAGSHIFGVEPASFYPLNLFLNCNVSAVLFFTFPLITILTVLTKVHARRSTSLWKRLVFLSPPYLYLAILAQQPHKEERFLVPAYPFIAIVAAVALADVLALLARVTFSLPVVCGRIGRSLIWTGFVLLAFTLGPSRIYMQIHSFSAPVSVYTLLSDIELKRGLGPRNAPPQFLSPSRQVNICVGKEWYRFPSSFFLPHKRFRIRFVRTGFTGLMPKPFQEDANGTRVIPEGMNEFNKEDPNQFYDWQSEEGCHYFVDLDLSHRYVHDDESEPQNKHPSPVPEHAQALIFRNPFLDSDMSHAGFRAFYLPGFEHKLVYGKYQLIRNLDLIPVVE